MRSAVLHILRRLRGEESGQSLIVVALAMFVVIGISAMAIDVASWYQKHHQAQVVADAAALAAANCLANPNTGPNTSTDPQCTSGTDTADATTVADNYAVTNGVPKSDLNVSFSGSQVTVTANTTAPAIFSNLLGIKTASQTAGSTAAWTAGGPTPCSKATSKTQCSAIYAANTGCSTSDGFMSGTNSSGGGTIDIAGGIHSEGLEYFNNNGSVNPISGVGSPALTVSGSCYSSSSLPTKDSYTATQVPSEPWPVNYAAAPYFTACTTTCTSAGSTGGTTVNGVPSYCTQATTSSSGFTFTDINGNNELPVSGNVYCAIGSGTASNPATWNGPITIESSDCNSPPAAVTFIGGNVAFSNGPNGGTDVCLQPALDNCLVYSNGNVTMTNSTFAWTGDIFDPDPTGTIQVGTAASGVTATSTSGMLEGYNVSAQNTTLTLTGDGPIMSGGSSGSGGTDSLVQ